MAFRAAFLPLIGRIDWVDGWPVFAEDRFDVPQINTAFREEIPKGPPTPDGLYPAVNDP